MRKAESGLGATYSRRPHQSTTSSSSSFFPPPTVNIMEDELQIELELKRSQKQLPPHLYLQYLNWPDPREVKKMSSLKSLPLN